jgi:hypothetical protein
MTEKPQPPAIVDGAPIPGRPAKCATCAGRIVFARTLSTPNRRGGKSMPLDPLTNAAGNVAVRDTGHGRLVCRVLGKGEDHDHFTELRAMTHFATCPGTGRNIAAAAEAFLAEMGS